MKEKLLFISLLGLAVLASGCTDSKETYEGDVTIAYDDEIDENRAGNISVALSESGWEGHSAEVTKVNSTWFQVDLETNYSQDERLSMDQQYELQQTMTMLKYQAFLRGETAILSARSPDGEEVRRFVQ